MERVRLGVIGCGVIGKAHLRSAAESAELVETVAVADLREDAARAAAETFGVKKTYPSGKALLDDAGVEAVILAMPAFARTELALHAFKKGKHVLTEKPVAMNAGEVQKMIQARGKLVAGCCSPRFRFTKNAKAASDFVATGALGDLRVVRCRAVLAAGKPPQNPPPPWRLKKAMNGGGILLNWGCYDLDYLLGITGWKLKPQTVLAQTWTVPPQLACHAAPDSDAETYYTALIRCGGGTMLSLERGEFMPAQTETAWQIIGVKGSLKLTMTGGKPRSIIHDDTSTETGVVTKTLWEGEEDLPPANHLLVQDFARAIREGRQPETSLEKSLVIQQISDGIYASAEKGCAVTIASHTVGGGQ